MLNSNHLYSWNNDTIRWFNHIFKEVFKFLFLIFPTNTQLKNKLIYQFSSFAGGNKSFKKKK